MIMIKISFTHFIVDGCGDRGTASFLLPGAVPWYFHRFVDSIIFVEPVVGNHHDKVTLTGFKKDRFIWNQYIGK